MERHFHKQLDDLKKRLLHMSLLVQGALYKACESLLLRDVELAKMVLAGEHAINDMEIEIDEMGHGLFAVGQPMAVDLRLMTMILKMTTDLERIGDHAVNIAQGVISILEEDSIPVIQDLIEMIVAVKKMYRAAMDSFVYEDPLLAQTVLAGDDEIDHKHYLIVNYLSEQMENSPTSVKTSVRLMMISHNLERIADLANNIAEDVIYWKQGREVRHHAEIK